MRLWQVAWLLHLSTSLSLADDIETRAVCPAATSSVQSLEWPVGTRPVEEISCPVNAPHSAQEASTPSLDISSASSTASPDAQPVEPSSTSSSNIEGGESRQAPETSSPTSTGLPPKQTHFPSFNEWKDQHDTHHSLRERLAKASISKAAAAGATAATDPTLQQQQQQQQPHSGQPQPVLPLNHESGPQAPPQAQDAAASNTTVELDKPISYIHPLPFTGTGQPEDPLLPLSARTNYASFDCSAAVLQSSKPTKGASSILNNSKDRYMLTPCDAPEKFVIVELCEEIDVDALVLANWEFFSSMFKHFQVRGSEVYPGRPEDWMLLGTFRAGNVRAPQVFRPPSLRRFVRYLRIDFQSHYGTEHFCPVSLVRVYGRNHLEAFRDEEAERRAQQLLEQQIVEQQQAQLVDVEVQAEVVATSALAAASSTQETTTEGSQTAPASPPASASSLAADRDSAQASSNSTNIHHAAQQSEDPTANLTSADAPMGSTKPLSQPIQEKDALNVTQSPPQQQHHHPTPPLRPSQHQQPANHHFPQGESIYGAITKRLTALERDASLTLDYVEEQSRLIQEMFSALDHRLLTSDQAMARTDQILRRLVLDQELHRAQVENERTALASQVNVLAEEIVRSKRLSLVQLVGTLLILGFVAATRGSSALVSMQQLRRSQRSPSSAASSAAATAPTPATTSDAAQHTPSHASQKLHRTVPASARRNERLAAASGRVTPLQRVPSKRSAASRLLANGPRSAVPAPDRGRTSRPSAPTKLFRSLTPPPRFATAGDTFSPSTRAPLAPSVRGPKRIVASIPSNPTELSKDAGSVSSRIEPTPHGSLSAAPSRTSLKESPGTTSDRWLSTSGDESSSDNDDASDVVSPIKNNKMSSVNIQHRTHHRRPSGSSSEEPQTPLA